jgi:hypothetical protein
MGWEKYIPEDISELYEVHDYKHAAAILANEFPDEFNEVCEVLRTFRFTKEDVIEEGGSESKIPKRFSEILRPLDWQELQLNAKIILDDGRELNHTTHLVDYLKGRVAFDLEWNSKDQTYDRDLITFKAFFEYDTISLAILVTRSNELDDWFKSLGTFVDKDGKVKHVYKKFGASTTHMGKLLSRMEAGRNGGCPILIFGITPRLVIPE